MAGERKKFDEFVAAVKDSVEGHAKRKNYTTGGVDDPNQLLNVMTTLGIHDEHSIGEIVYKCAEYLKTPRDAPAKRVLMEKVAGWAWVIWRELP